MAPVSTRTRKKLQKLEERKKQKTMARPLCDECSTVTSSSVDNQEVVMSNKKKKNKVEENNSDDHKEDICSTPKAKRFRIPEVLTCPPAPKKRRVITPPFSSINRSPVALFASPDIELFLFSALKNVSA